MKKLVLLFIIGLLAVSASAQVLIDGLKYNLNRENHTAEIAEENTVSGDLVIPETVVYEGNSYVITSIGLMAFRESKELQSIVMPNSITQIKKDAFCNCSKLTSVHLSDNLISIGQYAFQNCRSLTSIEFPASLNTIESCAFANCGLTSVFIPKSVSRISAKGEGAMIVQASTSPFISCKNLSSINVEEGNPIYDSRDGCNAIIETSTNTLFCGCNNSTIPNSVTAIWITAFFNCGFTSMIIPDGVTSIGIEAFAGCENLTEITIPNSVTSLGERAFWNCTALTTVKLSENVKKIESSTFNNCSNLTSISLPDGLTTIRQEAFAYCSSLSSISLPNNLTDISPVAFYGCSNLTSIEIGTGLSSITGFYNTGLKSVEIPPNIVSIGKHAFRECPNLTEVIFHEGLTSIGGYAFYGCDNYTDVILPSTITNIGMYSFTGNKDKTVTCYAATVPTVNYYGENIRLANPFLNRATNKTFATTLTVPDVALQEYARTYPWNEFGTIMSFSGEIAEPDLSGIKTTESSGDAYEIARYSVDGRFLEHPQKGINIIRFSDGTIKKVMEQ